MRAILVVWLMLAPLHAQGPRRALTLPQILERLGQAADAFRRVAPTAIAEETLQQRTRKEVEGAADYVTHEVVSEYGYAALKEAPGAIHEVRKVISVDGKQVSTVAKARQTLTLGVKSADDKLKKRLLEEFEKHGLRGAVTDFGQLILLFSPRHLKEYEFKIEGDRDVGADPCIVISYRQLSGPGGVTVFRGNAADREPLHGEILVRKTDALPLRISMTAVQTSKNSSTKDESTVDYAESQFGSVLPSGVAHREYLKDELVSENVFTYSTFRKIEGGDAPKLPGN